MFTSSCTWQRLWNRVKVFQYSKKPLPHFIISFIKITYLRLQVAVTCGDQACETLDISTHVYVVSPDNDPVRHPVIVVVVPNT